MPLFFLLGKARKVPGWEPRRAGQPTNRFFLSLSFSPKIPLFFLLSGGLLFECWSFFFFSF